MRVLGCRPDGFHALESLVAFADCGDTLTFEPGLTLSLDIGGPFGAGLAGTDNNLVMRAAREAAKRAEGLTLGRFHLDKRLPVASGLGGGSSDAAAALRLVSDANPGLLPESLQTEIADALGSDIRVCLHGRAAWMEGRGERVTPAPALPPLWAVLANPGLAVSTAEIFRLLNAGPVSPEEPAPPPGPFADIAALVDWLARNSNDLEPPAMALAPVIAEVLESLAAQRGASLARMSGSGATCFALFADGASADAAAAAIENAQPGWWTVSTSIF